MAPKKTKRMNKQKRKNIIIGSVASVVGLLVIGVLIQTDPNLVKTQTVFKPNAPASPNGGFSSQPNGVFPAGSSGGSGSSVNNTVRAIDALIACPSTVPATPGTINNWQLDISLRDFCNAYLGLKPSGGNDKMYAFWDFDPFDGAKVFEAKIQHPNLTDYWLVLTAKGSYQCKTGTAPNVVLRKLYCSSWAAFKKDRPFSPPPFSFP